MPVVNIFNRHTFLLATTLCTLLIIIATIRYGPDRFYSKIRLQIFENGLGNFKGLHTDVPETHTDPSAIGLPLNLPLESEQDLSEWMHSIGSITARNKYGHVTIVTVAHFGLKAFVHNWIMSLERNSFSKFVVLCCDQQLLDHLNNCGYEKNAALVPNEWIDFNLTRKKSSIINLLNSSQRYGII
jgi:hypothetical protein